MFVEAGKGPPITTRYKVEGVAEVDAELQRLMDEIPDAIEDANRAAVELVIAAALPHVPVRTGRLRRSLKSVATPEAGVAYAGGPLAPYANTIHWGRIRGNVGSPPRNHQGINMVKGRPFLTDALEAVRVKATEEYQKAIDEIVEEADL